MLIRVSNIKRNNLLDRRFGRASRARARQLQLPSFLGVGMGARREHRRSGRREHDQRVNLRVQGAPGAARLHATLEPAVVTFVRGVRDQQVVAALVRIV